MDEQNRQKALQETEDLLKNTGKSEPTRANNTTIEDADAVNNQQKQADSSDTNYGQDVVEEMAGNQNAEDLADVLESGARQSPPM